MTSQNLFLQNFAEMASFKASGSFLALGRMRGRKPRRKSSETAFCLLVAHLLKPLTYKAFIGVFFLSAGRAYFWLVTFFFYGEIYGVSRELSGG